MGLTQPDLTPPDQTRAGPTLAGHADTVWANAFLPGLAAITLTCIATLWPNIALAQNSWSAGTQPPVAAPGANATTAVQPRQPARQSSAPPVDLQSAMLTLRAYLTAEADVTGQQPIDRGLVWRVFSLGVSGKANKLIMSRRDAVPTVRLPVGQYAINAAFGRAHLTRIVRVNGGTRRKEAFVLNAGGLKVITKVDGGARIAKSKARYDIYSDERDQSGARQRVVTNARPGLITRLNSGIYHVVSRLGDANALVSAEVAVEAGKLTEAVVSHEAAKVTFKLVENQSGEAHADTEWIIMTRTGDIVKETAGALPTHVLAPGNYSVSARRAGKLYTRTFDINSGDNVEVEVMMR